MANQRAVDLKNIGAFAWKPKDSRMQSTAPIFRQPFCDRAQSIDILLSSSLVSGIDPLIKD